MDKQKKSGTFLIVGIFIATLITTSLSFLSLKLAMLSLGVFAFGLTLAVEFSRRRQWENNTEKRFDLIDKKHTAFADTQAQNTKDIYMLKKILQGLKLHKPSAPGPITQKADTFANILKTTAPLPKEVANPKATAQPKQKIPPKIVPKIKNVSGFDNFDTISDNVIHELIEHALAENDINVFIQPIVRLPQRQIRFYEMFARIRARPGQYIPASRYMKVAEQDNNDDKIDNLLLLHGLNIIKNSADLQNATPFVLNIKRSTLKNPDFMKCVLNFIQQNRALANRLVFEIQHKDFDTLQPAFLEIIRGMGQLGCAFSLDHVQSLKLDISNLQRFKIRYIKIIAAKMLEHTIDKKTLTQFQREKNALESNGIGVIVEHIETEKQMRDLLDFDIHYGQGYLFGKPDLERAYTNKNNDGWAAE